MNRSQCSKCGYCKRELQGPGKSIGSTTLVREFCSYDCLGHALERYISWHQARIEGGTGSYVKLEAARIELDELCGELEDVK
jgi:hypothetical protein